MIRESRMWLSLALVVALFWLLWRLGPVLTPFAVAAGLAYLGDPLVDRLERLSVGRWRVGRTLAVVVVFALMTLAVAVLLVIVIPLLVDQVRGLIQRFPEYLDWFTNTALPWVGGQLGLDLAALDLSRVSALVGNYWKEMGTAVAGVFGSLGRGGQAVVAWLTSLVLIPVVTFYLLRDWDRLLRTIREMLPRGVEPTVTTLARDIDEVLGAFFRGQLVVMVALGTIYWLGLWIVGIDAAFLIGMGAGLLSIVPYLGSIVGLLAAVIAAVFQYQDFLHVALVLVVFAVGQMAEGMVLTPKLVGDQVGLHPVVVIFAVLAGGQLFGFLGILLALPVASALKVLVAYWMSRYRESDTFLRPPRRPAEANNPAPGAEAGAQRSPGEEAVEARYPGESEP